MSTVRLALWTHYMMPVDNFVYLVLRTLATKFGASNEVVDLRSLLTQDHLTNAAIAATGDSLLKALYENLHISQVPNGMYVTIASHSVLT
ncbi:hypothetical protein GGI01_002933 [Coemansia sp. RSA 376]|nr:hypothetical protein GGI01_002933 [Coemansia sp. RSA 376]